MNQTEAFCRLGEQNAEHGIHHKNAGDGITVSGVLAGEPYRSTDKAAARPFMYFDVDSAVAAFGDTDLTITVVARCPAGKKSSLTVCYESTTAYRETPDTWTLPGDDQWYEHAFHLTDANFADTWGWNFRIDASLSPSDVWVKEVRIRRNGPRRQRGPGAESPQPLYILNYDHLGKILWGEERFMRTFREGLAWLEKYPHFKLGIENEAYLYDYLAEERPALFEELRQGLAKYPGRLGIGTCTYGQPLSVFINEESNVRQLVYGIRTCEKRLGYTPRLYMMSEHAMHSQIPQLLAGTGFDGAIMRTFFMAFGYNPTFDLPIGWWVGLDGTRIATVPTYPGENAAFGLTTVDNWILTRYPDPLVATKSLAGFKRDFAHIQPLLAGRVDDAILRREELVQEFDGTPGSGYRWILADELLALFPRPASDMKTAPNDFAVRMPWGACGNRIWNTTRAAEVQVCTAERLAAIAHLVGAGNPHEAALETAWKNVLVAQHHDITITFRENDARQFVGGSLAASGPVLANALRSLAAGLHADGPAQLTIFNPCSWPRREWIETEVPPGLDPRTATVHRAGRSLPTVRVPKPDPAAPPTGPDRLAVLADLPALSVTSFSLAPPESAAAPSPSDVCIDPAHLRITTPDLDCELDPQGGIRSLVSRKSSTPIFAPNLRSGFFAGIIDDQAAVSQGTWEILVPGPAGDRAPWAIARERGTVDGVPYTLEIRFSADTPRLDCRVEITFPPPSSPKRIRPRERTGIAARAGVLYAHDEKLRFKVFPAVAPDAIGVRDLPFAVAETSDRILQGNYWTALADGHAGLAVFNRGNMGACREADGGFSIPLAFLVGGNKGQLAGRYDYQFALYPFAGPWQKADLHRQAIAYNFPPIAMTGQPGDGRWGDQIQPLSIDGDGVLVSALYTDAGRVYLRMYESTGAPARASILPPPLSAAPPAPSLPHPRLIESDMLGRAGKALPNPVPFGPWQIRTILLEPGGRGGG